MANNTTWSFTGLPSGSSILSYSPPIPGVVFGLVNSDGVRTVLNAGGTPTQAGNFTPTIRVGTNACYKDVRVNLNVTQAATPAPVKSCAVALANGTSRYGLNVRMSTNEVTFDIIPDRSLDITPSEYGTFSFSHVSGQEVPGLSLVARPETGTHWSVRPAHAITNTNIDAATIAALDGKVFHAVWRVTFTSTSGCQASLDFPVYFVVFGVYPSNGGSFEGGG